MRKCKDIFNPSRIESREREREDNNSPNLLAKKILDKRFDQRLWVLRVVWVGA
jgi:hypothetical protein